jgi:hypothetical protein
MRYEQVGRFQMYRKAKQLICCFGTQNRFIYRIYFLSFGACRLVPGKGISGRGQSGAARAKRKAAKRRGKGKAAWQRQSAGKGKARAKAKRKAAKRRGRVRISGQSCKGNTGAGKAARAKAKARQKSCMIKRFDLRRAKKNAVCICKNANMQVSRKNAGAAKRLILLSQSFVKSDVICSHAKAYKMLSINVNTYKFISIAKMLTNC